MVGRARLRLVRLRPLLADVLADLQPAQPLDHPRAQDQHQEERGQAGHRGAERDVADDVERPRSRGAARRGGGRALRQPSSCPEAGARQRVHDLLHAHAARALHEHGVAGADEAPRRRAAAAAESAKAARADVRARPASRAPSRKCRGQRARPPTSTSSAPGHLAAPVSRCSSGPRGAQLQHVAQEGHAAAARGHVERGHRRLHRRRVRVVAVVEQGDAAGPGAAPGRGWRRPSGSSARLRDRRSGATPR